MVVMVMMVVVAVVVTVMVDFGICLCCCLRWCLCWCWDWILGSSVPICQRILLIAECELHKEIASKEDVITGLLCLSVVVESYVGHFSMLVEDLKLLQ